MLAPANWEELQLNLELSETAKGPRWLIASLYKDYHGPTAGTPGTLENIVDADPEEERNC